ncbi:MAG: ABC transporter ATP-binding protein [Oscillospiraceae bacterium]|nr:ABC transporter ATP-binding protein [Oscillospiraceae bacterium]
MSGSEPILSVRDLSAGYGAGRMVADVSFTLGPGEILCLVGESGCGKSTLLKAVMGTTPGLQVLSGEIILEGRSLLALPPRERQRICCDKFGLVSQSPGASFNPIRSYRKQFTETLKSHGKYDRNTFDAQVDEAFGKLSLNDRERILASCPYEMSGGMNQRIAFSLALLLGQDILLADEPTSALDATVQLQVAQELRRLRDVSGIAQIIVTHNLALAQFLADRIGVMYAGRLVELGTPEQVLGDPRHPYTRALIAAIPSLQGGMPVGLQGQPPLEGPADAGCEFCERCPVCRDGCAERRYAPIDAGGGHMTACGCADGGV